MLLTPQARRKRFLDVHLKNIKYGEQDLSKKALGVVQILHILHNHCTEAREGMEFLDDYASVIFTQLYIC